MAYHNELGQDGENKVLEYLVQLGYTILERNWTLKGGELDIICTNGEFVIFVEVKTRLLEEEYPEELLNLKKRANLRKLANAYIRMKNIQQEVRIDLIQVIGKKLEIKHIIDAVQVFE